MNMLFILPVFASTVLTRHYQCNWADGMQDRSQNQERHSGPRNRKQ